MTVGSTRAVAVMAKQPCPGKTKTRLTPDLTPQQAADLYEAMLIDTIALLTNRDDCDVLIAVDEPSSAPYFEQLAPSLTLVAQGSGPLGQRLDTVLTSGLEIGYQSMFAINSDGPDLPPEHLTAAFDAIDHEDVDVVLGPTEDGGYYLIGWKQRWTSMVTEVTMSTPDVFADTLAIASELGARVQQAPSWYDVDHVEDLERLAISLNNASLVGHSTQTASFLEARTPT